MAALRRRESRGGHYREDHPEPDAMQQRRGLVEPGAEDTVVTVTPVPEPVARAAGLTLAEYALILSLIAILAVAALLFLGGAIAEQLSQVGQQI